MATQLVDVNANPFLTDVVSQGNTLNALNAAVTMQLRGQASTGIQVTGIGSLTLAFETTVDNSNWFAVLAYPFGGGAAVTTTTANGQWACDTAGCFQFRVRVSAFTSGSAIVSVVCAQGGDLPQAISTTGNAREDLIAWAGTALGTPTNFGTTPTAVIAGSVNASIMSGTTALGAPNTFGTTAPTGNALGVNASLFVGTTLGVASSAGVLKVGIAGGVAGAAIDGAIAAAPPANALQIAPKAQNTNPANATAGNAVALNADLAGKLVVVPVAQRLLVGKQATTIAAASTAETTIITAGGAGVFKDLIGLVVTTTNATAATLTIREATAGATVFILDFPDAAVVPAEPIFLMFPVPIPQAAAANNWTAQASANANGIHITALFASNL